MRSAPPGRVQQATERRNAHVPALEHLVLRIGVSAGDVQFVAHDCHGTPGVEAARLESAAEPGSIFVSALVRSLVGSRGSYTFEGVGALELKGLPGPVETFRVPWAPATDAGGPLPHRWCRAVPGSTARSARCASVRGRDRLRTRAGAHG